MAKTKTTKRKAQPSQELFPRPLKGKKGVQTSRARLTVGTKTPKTKALLNYDGKSLTIAEIDSYSFLNFGKPEIYQIPHEDGFIQTMRIQVKQDDQFLGYLPMVKPYAKHFVQLCYNIVYNRAMVKATNQVKGGKVVQRWALDIHDMSARKLRYYLYVRRAIMEEIALNTSENSVLKTFNEYVIKERFDLHFDAEGFKKSRHRLMDPLAPESQKAMGKAHAIF
jgi:hypothetical protein